MSRDEAMLVAQATQMGFEDFYRALSYWKQLADPDGADADEVERTAARNVYLEASVDGMWLGQMTLDPISGAIVYVPNAAVQPFSLGVACKQCGADVSGSPSMVFAIL